MRRTLQRITEGHLAIVVPHSILNSSSVQYVRDEIEALFHIVAVISLPQTAFIPPALV